MLMKFSRFAATLWTIALLLAAGPMFSFAADAKIDVDRETQRPSRAGRKSKSLSQAAKKAGKRRAAEGAGERITYQQIFKDPDNIDLNFRYAKQQIVEGDLKGASATLERILMVDPALPRVRLLFAVVHLRLDNLYEAEKELTTILKLPMPSSLRGEIDEYMRIIRRRRRRTNISARFGAGFQYDTNRNAAPNSGQRLFLDVARDLVSGRKEDDQSLIALGHIGIVHDLGVQAGHELFANYNYFRAEQAEISLLDMQAHSYEAGFKYRSSLFGDFKFGPVGSYVTLDANTPYLRTQGAKLSWKRTLSKKTSLDFSVRTVFERFLPSVNLSLAEDRSGGRSDLRFGIGRVLTPSQYLSVHAFYMEKDAQKRFNAFTRLGIRFTHQWMLGKGRFMLSSLTAADDEYRLREAAIASGTRSDNTLRIGLTFGTPMDFVHKGLKDIIATTSYNMFHSFSNMTNYEYTNHSLNAMLTYKFEY